MNRKPLYIETLISCDLDTLWSHTQEPQMHEQWDLRFSEIRYHPKREADDPQQFLYSTRVGFGISVSGVGESVATKTKDNGESTSVLKFSSESSISLIRKGSGYWKYKPETNGVKFYTGYDYDTRWGSLGRVVDKFVFRPMMVWATAWSFDCLKNWIERSVHPKQALLSQTTVLLTAIVLSVIWLYQGIVPKLLFTDTGELEILRQSGLFSGIEETLLTGIGIGEVVWGLVLLFFHRRLVHYLNIAALLLLGLGALFSNATVFTQPFNPFSLNIAMIGLSLIAIANLKYIPRASNCITKQRK
ncbi:DoxX-like family protein [Pontibacter pamirensis]|uniref:DoxX-like family protein n=1 Tax=Pontibacter pamirensis TaxID=2562824 RepID=UPI0013894EEC|nr:DoxX-like family protein [Pontibacter pamirensis]